MSREVIRSVVDCPGGSDVELHELPPGWYVTSLVCQDDYLTDVAVAHQNNVAASGADTYMLDDEDDDEVIPY